METEFQVLVQQNLILLGKYNELSKKLDEIKMLIKKEDEECSSIIRISKIKEIIERGENE